MKKLREQYRDMETLAETFGLGRPEWENLRSGHVRAIFRCPSQSVAVTMAKGHGGDPRARLNNIKTARREIQRALAKVPDRVHA